MFYSILLYCAAAILGDLLVCIVCIVVFICLFMCYCFVIVGHVWTKIGAKWCDLVLMGAISYIICIFLCYDEF